MEPVAAVPAELLALATPVADRAAPLLRSAVGEADAAGPTVPFDALLAMLDTLPLDGQALPPAGNSLPLPVAPLPPPLVAAHAAVQPSPTSTTLPAAAAPMAAAPHVLEPAGLALPASTTAPAGDGTAPRFELSSAWRGTPAVASAPSASVPAAAHANASDVAGAPLPVVPPPPADPLATASPALAAAIVARPQAAATTLSERAGAPATQSAEQVLERIGMLAARDAAPRESVARVATDEVEAANALSRAAEARSATAAPPLAVAAQAPVAAASTAPVDFVVRRSDAASTPTPVVAATAGVEVAAPSTPLAPLPAQPSASTAQATPLSPADPSRGPAVDTRSPTWTDAFASRVQWLVDHRVGEARIKLNPPELGAVDVKISLVDDKTYVQLTAATAAARDELSQGLPRLRDLFVASGIELGGASVQGGRDGRGHDAATGYEMATRSRGAGDELDVLPGSPPTPARAVAAGRIDVFA